MGENRRGKCVQLYHKVELNYLLLATGWLWCCGMWQSWMVVGCKNLRELVYIVGRRWISLFDCRCHNTDRIIIGKRLSTCLMLSNWVFGQPHTPKHRQDEKTFLSRIIFAYRQIYCIFCHSSDEAQNLPSLSLATHYNTSNIR